MVNAIGVDHLGIGSGTDLLSSRVGSGRNPAWPDLTGGFVRAVAGEMLYQGFTPDEIAKVGGGNYCRIFGEVTATHATSSRTGLYLIRCKTPDLTLRTREVGGRCRNQETPFAFLEIGYCIAPKPSRLVRARPIGAASTASEPMPETPHKKAKGISFREVFQSGTVCLTSEISWRISRLICRPD